MTQMMGASQGCCTFASRVPEKAWPIVSLTSDSSKQITFDHMRALALLVLVSLQRLESIFLKAEAESRLRRDIVSALSVASDKAIPLIARVTAHYKPAKREFRSDRVVINAQEGFGVVLPENVGGFRHSFVCQPSAIGLRRSANSSDGDLLCSMDVA